MDRLRPKRGALGVVALVLVVAGLVPQSAAAGIARLFAAQVSPSAPAGAASWLSITLVNESEGDPIRAADVGVPAAFALLDVTQPSKGTAAIQGDTVVLRSLAVKPGESLTVGVRVRVPCEAGQYRWSAAATREAEFEHAEEQFTLDDANSSLVTGLSGACALRFLVHPQDAQVDRNITGADFDTGGPPVQVGLFDANGNLTPFSNVLIHIAIANNPGGGALSGDTSSPTVDGVATFSPISIDRIGLNYTLMASSEGVSSLRTRQPESATSEEFDIHTVGVVCGEGPCQATVSTDTTTGKVGAMAQPGDLLSASFGLGSVDCPDYDEASDFLTYNFSGNSTKQAVLTLDADVVASLPDPRVARFQVCYAADSPFTQRDGTPAPQGEDGFYFGLLPDCGATPVPPCLLQKGRDRNDNVFVKFVAPAGDPRGGM